MNPSQAPIVEGSHGASPARQQREAWRYLLPILLLPELLILTAWLVLPTQWFRMRSQNTYLPNLGYGAKLHGRACDIVIFGDSSAMAGIDPRVLQQHTGLTACNIAEAAGITEVAHLLPVDNFLANNPRPRFLVFYFAPFDFNIVGPWNEELINTGEGISYLIEHESTGRAALTLAQHPQTFFSWSEAGLRLALQHAMSKPFGPDVFKLRDDTGGRFVYPNTSRTVCDPSTVYRQPPNPAFISYMRTHYATGGTQVLVDAAPAPVCDPNLDFYRQNVTAYIDNRPYPTLPLSSFSAEGRLHPNNEGSPAVTVMLANQINSLAHSGGGN